MLFYILFICIVLSLFFLSRVFPEGSRRYYFFELVGLFVIIFIGIFRFDVGWDYINYYNYIDKIEVNQIIRLEPLSQIFCIIAILFDNPPLLFVLFGLPTYLIFFHSFKKYSVNFQLSVLIFLAFFYLESFTSVRQILALSISFWGFKYILKQSLFKYVLVVGFAALFHVSALAALFIYPVYRFLSLRMLVFIIPILFLAKEILLRVLYVLDIYSYYIDKLDEYTGVFQYSCTSRKTMEIAGALMECGINYPKIVDDTFYTKTYNQNRIMGLALLKSRLHLNGKCISSVITRSEEHTSELQSR